jgi:hypothetical protein
MSNNVDLLLALTRFVKTPEGAKHFKQPIGSPITSKRVGKMATAKSLVEKLKTDGGFTYRPPTYANKGVSVAVTGHEQIFDSIDAITDEDLYKFGAKVLPLLRKNPTYHIGGWYDTETKQVFLDVAELFDRKTSIREGIKRKERAVYDLGEEETIDLRGPPYSPEVAAIRKELHLANGE